MATCNNCKLHVETRYHCQECDDFDLCTSCYIIDVHQHKMAGLGMSSAQDAHYKSVQRCIQSVEHTAQCIDANCILPSCQKVKKVFAHTEVCKEKSNGSCSICKQLITLCVFHARGCKDRDCVMPYCCDIKQKQRQQKMQLMKRRMQQMAAGSSMNTGSFSTPSTPTITKPVAQSSPQYNVSQSGSNIGQQATVGNSSPPNVLEAVKEVQAAAAQQVGSTGKGNPAYGKGNPSPMGTKPSPQMVNVYNHQQQMQQMRPQQHMMNSMGKPVNQMGATMGKPNSMQAPGQQGQQPQGPNRSLPGMEQVWNRYPNGGNQVGGNMRPQVMQAPGGGPNAAAVSGGAMPPSSVALGQGEIPAAF